MNLRQSPQKCFKYVIESTQKIRMDEVIDLLTAAKGYVEESLRLQNEKNIEGSLTMLREAVLCMVTYLKSEVS